MKKVIGIILLIIGILGTFGIFFSKAGLPSLEYGFAYLIGRLSPLGFLIIGLLLIKKKKNE